MQQRTVTQITSTLKDKYKSKLKGTGAIKYHLRMDFFRDGDDTLCMVPCKYIEKICDFSERMFGHLSQKDVMSPMEKNAHPELDTYELLDPYGIQQYQSLINALQWVVSIGRFDIQTTVMTLSSFRVAPHHGYFEQIKCIYGYIA